MNELLKRYVDMAPYVNDFTEDDLAVAICDKEKIVKCVPGENVSLRVEEGQLLWDGLALAKAVKQNEKITVFIPKKVHGDPMTATAVPILDEENRVIGGIGTVKKISDKEELQDIIRILANSLAEMSKTTTQISSSADEIASSGGEMISYVNSALKKTEETDEVIRFVQQVAKQTNLLGLNAAIEAARAGETGKGFQVVAQEIRKLAVSSNESANKIASVLKDIQKSVTQILEMVEKNGTLTQEQAAGTEEITAEISEISNLASKLKEFSNRL